PGRAAGLLEVAGGAVGDLPKDELFGKSTTQGHLDVAFELGLREQVTIVFGTPEYVAQSADAAGDDGYLVYRMSVGKRARHQGVARLMIGDALFLVVLHDATLALQADSAALDGFVEFRHVDGFLVVSGSHQCR